MLLPRLPSSLARDGEAECSTPDSGGSVGAARAAVLSPRSPPCPGRARGLGAPGSARVRPGSQVRTRPGREGGERGRPVRSRVAGPRPSGVGPGAWPACGAPAGTSPRAGAHPGGGGGRNGRAPTDSAPAPDLGRDRERLGKFGPVPRRSWRREERAQPGASPARSALRAARAWAPPRPPPAPPSGQRRSPASQW